MYAAVFTLCAVKIVSYFHATNLSTSRQEAIPVGQHVDLRDQVWDRSKYTLVFAISSNCHFCTSSAGFYQRLVSRLRETARSRIATVAAIPEDKDTASDYLDRVIKVKFDAVSYHLPGGVHSTPTLLLVAPDGRLVEEWRGQLPHDREDQVLASIFKESTTHVF